MGSFIQFCDFQLFPFCFDFLLLIAFYVHILTLPTVVPLADCAAIYNSGLKISGLYYINPDGNGDFLVYCDMSQLDGVNNGWTVIQRRVSNSVDFNKCWNEYTIGFGCLDADFWLGLNKIKKITDTARYKLYIAVQYQGADVVNDQSVRFAEYNSFSLGTPINNYQLSVSSYNDTISTAGDSLIKTHNGMYFSTRDRDNDKSPLNCAVQYQSGWWFNRCFDSNLNGVWVNTGYLDTTVFPLNFGVSWKMAEKNQLTYSFKTAVMAVRTNR